MTLASQLKQKAIAANSDRMNKAAKARQIKRKKEARQVEVEIARTIREKEKEKNKETDNSDLSNKGAYAQMLIKGYRNVKKSFDKKTDKESDKKIEENIKRIKGLL